MAQLPAIQATRKSGKECFEGMDGENSLQDFWAWAFSDLVSNTERGKLAEYLVAKAMGCGTQISQTWESYDLLSPEGIKIEVKTSAYIQSWKQKAFSKISFGIAKTKFWDGLDYVAQKILSMKRWQLSQLHSRQVKKGRIVMKVLLINGSRRDAGCTYTALSKAAEAIESEGVETEIINVGSRVLKGEVDDVVKEAGEKVKTADGVIVGSPVYYASASGEIMMFLDRFFGAFGADMKYKPGSAVASARRGGTTSTIDDLNKYFQINQMPVVSSNYWNIVHGNTPEEVVRDEEGMQTMRLLGKNMAWLVKSIDAAKKQGVELPCGEDKIKTNFIR